MIQKSTRLDNVFYEIRGPIFEKAMELERQGYRITRLNIGNPAPFGFEAPDEIVHDIIVNLRNAQGYTDSKGLFAARKAIMHYCQSKGIAGVQVEDIIIGNGVSELILLAMQALLNPEDEILIPAPDYPLWTAAVNLSGGKAVHYLCDEASDWYPDVADLESKITSRTKGLVLINPNNPTGAVYPPEVLRQVVQVAERHNLIVFSDEIYDKILYEEVQHHATASFSEDVLFLTFGGLSKNYRAAGFRAGWLVVSGDVAAAKSYIEGLNALASMRLCSNVPAQFAIQTALGGYQSINELVMPTGRLRKQRDLCYEKLTAIPGITCVKPQGAFYMFPKIDVQKFNITRDEQFVLDLLIDQHVLLVQGTGFNWPQPDHFRVVYLPTIVELDETLDKLALFLQDYQSQ
ncbi:pyridoxal phosphate-dependent aminotransferase [Rufibacter psychrotolerans]|uniref:pyridoxal phosphate-dependent aminotransferase n=1 Tax=Rufibacter psychrotolerans TaxID=2812556 RepID=UPI001967499B|nr:pyridoxal phosphate-dependent aminotransferase [Rufibacter sp. SYSU D00308]